MSDPFSILGLPRTFRVTAAEVAAAHLRAAAALHPDRARDPIERDALMRRAAEAGQAKQRLVSDVARAETLIALLAPDAGGAESDPPLPGAFLMETMELRERIEAAVADADERRSIRSDVEARRAECLREVAEALDALEGAAATSGAAAGSGAGARGGGGPSQGAPPGVPDLGACARRARGALARLRYVERMLDRLREAAEASG
jgi:molecular chaperone HscB